MKRLKLFDLYSYDEYSLSFYLFLKVINNRHLQNNVILYKQRKEKIRIYSSIMSFIWIGDIKISAAGQSITEIKSGGTYILTSKKSNKILEVPGGALNNGAVLQQWEDAGIMFRINTANLGDTLFENLGILWYKEEDEIFKLMDTVLDTEHNTISTTTSHFSKYMVVIKTGMIMR